MAKKEKLSLDELLEQALVKDEDKPYDVPGNWVWTRVGSVSEFERGITFPSSAKNHENGENLIPCIRTANIQEQLEIDDLIYIDRSYMKNNVNKLLKPNDILMSSANSRELVGKVSFVESLSQEMTFGGFVLNIRARRILSKFLFCYLRLEFLSGNFMGQSTQTTNIANINSAVLGEYLFPLPPLLEQQRIVNIIESLFEKLDHAKELVQNVLDSSENRKSAVLHKAFTGELTTKWREENGVDFERDWGENQFDEVATVKSNLVNPKDYKHFPHIAPDNIEKRTGKLLDYNTIEQDGVTSGKHRFYPGQILYSKIRPYLSKVVIADFDGLCSADMYPIETELNTRYLWYYMLSDDFVMAASSAGSRSVLPKINQKELGQLTIVCPPMEEQKEIVRILDNLLENEQKAKELCDIIDKIDLMKKVL